MCQASNINEEILNFIDFALSSHSLSLLFSTAFAKPNFNCVVNFQVPGVESDGGFMLQPPFSTFGAFATLLTGAVEIVPCDLVSLRDFLMRFFDSSFSSCRTRSSFSSVL